MCPAEPGSTGVVQQLKAATNEPDASKKEVFEGHVVDVACVRKYPRSELAGRAREHTRECVLMGHCIESGYALVSEDGGLLLLDDDATLRVVDAVRKAAHDRGIRLRARRTFREGKMHTTDVEVVEDR